MWLSVNYLASLFVLKIIYFLYLFDGVVASFIVFIIIIILCGISVVSIFFVRIALSTKNSIKHNNRCACRS